MNGGVLLLGIALAGCSSMGDMRSTMMDWGSNPDSSMTATGPTQLAPSNASTDMPATEPATAPSPTPGAAFKTSEWLDRSLEGPAAPVTFKLPARPERVLIVEQGPDISVDLRDFDAVSVQQQTDLWCWAACAEMILAYDGIAMSQGDVAGRIHGAAGGNSLKVAAASRYEVYRALCPDIEVSFDSIWDGLAAQVDAAGNAALDAFAEQRDISVSWDQSQAFQGMLDDVWPPSSVPVDELKLGYPAVVGLRDSPDADLGHVYVLVGVDYSETSRVVTGLLNRAKSSLAANAAIAGSTSDRFLPGEYTIHGVDLIDPWVEDDSATPENEMRVHLTFEEFKRRADFVTTRADAAEALMRWSDLAHVEEG